MPLSKDIHAATTTNFTSTEVDSFESKSDDYNYINLTVVNEDEGLKVEYHSKIDAYKYRISLNNSSGMYAALYDIEPVYDDNGNGFEATIDVKNNSVPGGNYYVTITRARNENQVNHYGYGDGGNCYRNALVKVSNKKVKILKFSKIINHNATYKTGAYANPKDFLDKSLKDTVVLLYDKKDKVKNFTSSQRTYISNVAKKLTSGCSSDYDKVKAIYEYVGTNTYYDEYSNTKGKRYGTSDNPYDNIYNIEKNGKTSTRCVGYSAMLVSMFRSIGIPSKLVYGYHLLLPKQTWINNKPTSSTKVDKHYWVQFYINGEWKTADANMATSNTWERTSSTSSGTWNGGNDGKKALNNHIYLNPSAQQLAVTHYANGVYSNAIISKSKDVLRLKTFFNQKSGGKTNAQKFGMKDSTNISATRILSWNLDKLYSDSMYGYVEKIDIAGSKKKDGGMSGKGDFSELKKLKFFSASYNKKLTSLNFKNDSSLVNVYASSCGIKTLTATGCKALKTLNVGYNPLTSAKYTFKKTKTATVKAKNGGKVYVSYSGSTHK